eukprot:2894373-Prymnesium_polylepis.2
MAPPPVRRGGGTSIGGCICTTARGPAACGPAARGPAARGTTASDDATQSNIEIIAFYCFIITDMADGLWRLPVKGGASEVIAAHG